MVCRSCQETESRRSRHESRNVLRDQLCSRCGNLLGTADTVRRVRKKRSQLARFGLTESDGALLERRSRRDR